MVGGEYQTCEQVTSLRWCFVIFLLLAVGEGNIWTHFSFWMGRLRKQVKKCMRGCFPKLMQLKAAVWFACLNSWTIDRATSILILVLAKVVAKRKEARQPNWPERDGAWNMGCWRCERCSCLNHGKRMMNRHQNMLKTLMGQGGHDFGSQNSSERWSIPWPGGYTSLCL